MNVFRFSKALIKYEVNREPIFFYVLLNNMGFVWNSCEQAISTSRSRYGFRNLEDAIFWGHVTLSVDKISQNKVEKPQKVMKCYLHNNNYGVCNAERKMLPHFPQGKQTYSLLFAIIQGDLI